MDAVDGNARLDPGELVKAEAPSSDHPWSSTWARRDGRIEGLAIGAPEVILRLSGAQDGRLAPWHALIEREAASGSRLLLLARATEPLASASHATA